jgi:hypothetical protein
MSARTVTVGERNITIEGFSGRKGARLVRMLDNLGKAVPEIQREAERYRREYEANNTIDIDRALARAQNPPQPMTRERPVIEDGRAVCDDDGRPLVVVEAMLDEQNRPIMGPDPLGHISEEDWQASGHKLRTPRSPSDMEMLLNVLPRALELAETELAAVLALVAMPDAEVKQRGHDGSLKDALLEQGDALLDAPWDQLVELALAASEALQDQYRQQVRGRLGERLDRAARSWGLDRLMSRVSPGTNSTTPASTTSPTSSTDSLPPTDGTRSDALTEPAGVASEASSSG